MLTDRVKTQADAEYLVEFYRDAGCRSYWIQYSANEYEVRTWN